MVSDLYRDMVERAEVLERQAAGLTLDAKSRHISASESVSMSSSSLHKREHAADLRKFAARLPK